MLTLLKTYRKPLVVMLLVAFALWKAYSAGVSSKDAEWRGRWLQRDIADLTMTLQQEVASRAEEQRRRRDVAALDAKYTQELADAKAENDALQRKLDNGGRVLVKGRCPVPSSTEAASTSGVGHDATIELSPVAGRNVLGIRAGIRQDQSALRVLQDYIKTQCLK